MQRLQIQLIASADDWQVRRREIQDRWHSIMGPRPPLIARPGIEVLAEKRRENLVQQRV
ncbi:MAG: hypothetical protein ACYC0X_23380 [Pirellulaceae bacterium]